MEYVIKKVKCIDKYVSQDYVYYRDGSFYLSINDANKKAREINSNSREIVEVINVNEYRDSQNSVNYKYKTFPVKNLCLDDFIGY